MRAAISLTALLLAVLGAAPPAQAHLGYGIVAGDDGSIYFLDAVRSRVWKLSPRGQLTIAASGFHANTLVAAPDGSLYFENFNQSLWRLTRQGGVERVKLPAARTARAGALDEIIAVDSAGHLYFSEGNDFHPGPPRILQRTPSGAITVLAGGSAGRADGTGPAAQFLDIRAAAWAPDGALYVADADRVRRIAPDGRVTTLALRGSLAETGGFGKLYGIAVDSLGHVVVADAGHRRVYRVAPQGEVAVVAESDGSWTPMGVAVAPRGIYILERMLPQVPSTVQARMNSPRVVRVAPDGTTEIAVTIRGSYLHALAAVIPWLPPSLSFALLLGLGVAAAALLRAALRRRKRRAAPAAG